MLEAIAWGALGASSLLIGALIGHAGKLSDSAVGLILGFGAGTLISAVAFELTEEAYARGGADIVTIGLAAGALAYFAGNEALHAKGMGERRMSSSAGEDKESGTGLLLGSVLDGVPESAVLGTTLLTGSVGVPILAAIFLSNMPEAIGAVQGGSGRRSLPRVLAPWAAVVATCALASGLGYELLAGASGNVVGLLQAFAAGGVLVMLADEMIPKATRWAQRKAGLALTLGFASAYLLSTL